MRRAALTTGLLLAGVTVAGCAPSAGTETPTSTSVAPTSVSLPPQPQPAADRSCPYLTSDAVADADGEKVTAVQISADKPHPACFFYTFGHAKAVTVQVYVGDTAVARGLVDRAAPVQTSSKAELPGGWEGGLLSPGKGAVYAVAKAGTAIVVNTDQPQSVKGREITKQVIANLKL
ncbi:MAG: DUF2020 domain-containing protein [Kutzneria sp.]|nr:DUF2020 domain-containing protein [Kutzneria sp.]MBV9845675.1 DUF2020 domain-containing protein [Kutzneria sp.]